MTRCQASILLWINLFVWTFHQKIVDETGRECPPEIAHVPFISWPVQDAAMLDLQKCVRTGENAIIDKSRDMGASWLVLLLADHYWLFRPDSTILLTSRVEDLVDKRGNPLSLFWKIDHVHRSLPPWMLPASQKDLLRGGKYRSHMHLENPKNGSVINGQATTEHIGRGDRRLFVLYDEMAAMKQAKGAWQSGSDATSCKIANSTPIGPGTEFTRQRNNALRMGRPKLITLGYWNHPAKGREREPAVDEDGVKTGIANRAYWSTPWFENTVEERQDSEDIGQNVLIDHITSGNLYFNPVIVTNHIRDNGSDPMRCEMFQRESKRTGKNEWYFEEDPDGRWFIWCPLEDGMPTDQAEYVAFADLSYGKGSANSACAWMDQGTGEIVAEFVDPFISTYDMADEMCNAGKTLFKGGSNAAFLGYELNGPGEDWHRDLLRNKYPAIYIKRAYGKRVEKRSKEYGWRSNPKEKRRLLNGLKRAMARGEITVHSIPGLNEMMEYVFYDNGSIGPGHLQDDTTGAMQAHGDRVISYSGCVFMRAEVTRFVAEVEKDKIGTWGKWLGHEETWKKIKRGDYL